MKHQQAIRTKLPSCNGKHLAWILDVFENMKQRHCIIPSLCSPLERYDLKTENLLSYLPCVLVEFGAVGSYAKLREQGGQVTRPSTDIE